MSDVITRFAPSPTGFLHIGGARTALFNWLYAKAKAGKFYLRIEDTDQERSTEEAKQAIIQGLEWLGLDHDGEVMYQSENQARHKEIAEELLEKGLAYRCYCTPEELAQMREQAQAEKRSFRYDRRWRDRDASEAPEGVAPSIRLKAPLSGEMHVQDLIQGDITVSYEDLDDLVLLRSDGTPTYMLAVVVDDYDMGITHIIRGDDHLTNSFRQKLIYDALGWTLPAIAHVPLIHGSDGAKMSKRHGALGVEAYEEMGYLPEAICNYLLRLGWSHGDDEIISCEQAIAWFDIAAIGRSPSRFDQDKLDSVNAHYMHHADDRALVEAMVPFLKTVVGEEQLAVLTAAMPGLKLRAKRLTELAEHALFYIQAPTEFTEKAQKALAQEGWKKAIPALEALTEWNHDTIEQAMRELSESQEIGLGKIMGGIRAAITGSHASPSMFEAMEILGKEESLKRLNG